VWFHKKFASAISFSFLTASTVALFAAPAPVQSSDSPVHRSREAGAPAFPTRTGSCFNVIATLAGHRHEVRTDILTVIDYTKPSTERRPWVFDLAHARVLFRRTTAHGRNTGDNQAVRFSNAPNSLMTSPEAFLTGDPYIGKHGLSL
jgi:hypothetical protein